MRVESELENLKAAINFSSMIPVYFLIILIDNELLSFSMIKITSFTVVYSWSTVEMDISIK